MVDTLGLIPNTKLTTDFEELLTNEPLHSYDLSSKHHARSADGSLEIRGFGFHRSKPLNVGLGDDNTLEWIRATMPGLLRHLDGEERGNGEQIKTPEELEQAKSALQFEIQFFSGIIPQNKLPVSRVDLALTLPLDPREIIPLHRHARHRLVRKETETYFNPPPQIPPVRDLPSDKVVHSMSDLNTVRLHGSQATIQFYDKVNERRCKKKSNVSADIPCTRVEIQLRKKKLIAREFGVEDEDFLTLADLTFERCYRVFRGLLCEFDPPPLIPQFKPELNSFLALLSNHPSTWDDLGGHDPLEWWRMTTKPSDAHYKDVRRKVGRFQAHLKQLRWEHILPEDRLPDLVDVMPDGRQIFIPSPFHFES